MRSGRAAGFLFLVCLMAACAPANRLDPAFFERLSREKDSLSVYVWGEYAFTHEYAGGRNATLDIPVLAIDAAGFEALAGDTVVYKRAMLVVSDELAGEPTLTQDRVADFRMLLGREFLICFMTDDESEANRIASAVCGAPVDDTAVDAEGGDMRLYALTIDRVEAGEIPSGMSEGDIVPSFLFFPRRGYDGKQPERDARMLYKLFYPFG